MRLTDRLREAEEALARAEAVAERLPLPEELARIHHLRGNLFFPQGRLEECLQAHARSLDLARTARSVEAEVRALGGMGDA
ncbi:hypothetical protein OFM04_33600, partial [Escherichia coli]|nr:hypothetical protein [Escherichia coli]